MGHIPEMPPEAGEYSVEVRSESFSISGEYNFEQTGTKLCPAGCDVIGDHVHGEWGYVKKRHAITMYPASKTVNQGSVEILLEDIPKIRACLDVVEAYAAERA